MDGPGADAAPSKPSMGKRIVELVLGKPKTERKPRPHPFAHESTSDAESHYTAKQVLAFWGGIATLIAVSSLLLADRFSPHSAGWFGGHGASGPSLAWESWTLVPLFAGLTLLGFGFVHQPWAKRLTLVGWVLFGTYWGLTATDLFVKEDSDYVNFVFAVVGVYFFTYLAYHQWLDLARKSDTHALHFLNVTAFIAAGTYFLIAKITFLRVWLIHIVGNHTKWMLDLFGQGSKQNIQFIVDKTDSQGPVTFFYPQYYCDWQYRGDAVGRYCLENGRLSESTVVANSGFLGNLWTWTPEVGIEYVVPVSIILACTAIQSIMLFVGLFAGTKANFQRKLKASLIVGAIIYVLNLVRNTGIIWFYGQGHASFWMMHNAIGKGGSLLAMVGIAFAVFKWFPEFFHSLVSVLDLPDRDGPIERALKVGRRRPEAAAPVKFAGED